MDQRERGSATKKESLVAVSWKQEERGFGIYNRKGDLLLQLVRRRDFGICSQKGISCCS